MKNNLIKEEISRIREIMGFSLLVESKLPSSIWDELVTAFSKGNADALETSLKNMDSSVDSLGKAILDTSTKLGAKTEDIIAGLRAGTLANDIAENLFANVLKQGDSKLKRAFLMEIDKDIYDIFNIAADPQRIIKTKQGDKTLQELADLNQLDNWANRQKSFVDSSNFDSELKDAIKKQIDSDVSKIKSGAAIDVNIPKSLEEFHAMLSAKAKAAGFEPPSLQQLQKWQDELQKKFSTPEEAWDTIRNNLVKSKTFKDKVQIVGDTVNVTTAEGKKLLSTIFTNSQGKIRWFTLVGILGGLSLLGFLNLREGEADDYVKKFIENCKKLQGSIRKRKDIGATLFQEFGGFVDNYYIEVIYNMKATPVTIKGNEGYIDIDGTLTKLSDLCEDNKLADKKFQSSSSQKEYSQSLPDFKQFLTDNSMNSSDAVNDTGDSGYWKANGKNYEFKVTNQNNDKGIYIEDL